MQRFYSSLLMITLLLIFVGQAVASVAMVCEMPHMPTKTAMHAQMPMTQSSDTTAVASMSENMMQMDCCDDESTPQNDCKCPISGCAANSMVNVDTLFRVILLESEKVNISVFTTQINIPRSLYRPPMSA
ncbi:hypothetical protein DC53_13195 [Pseudoalteromonas fuliginea]|uniref:CopL family metal-binding regulatory protein n=2 Tax=Pseudoalteromonas fuliginea TaxID=1872678 RepID=A0ABD3Y7B2_9GAMM|nr:hypothetical protein DC53_13195 [Pseudoalteromonas fuliginea]